MTATTEFNTSLSLALTVEAQVVSLAAHGGTSRSLAQAAAEGLLLSAYTSAEQFIRELFFELVNGTTLATEFTSPLTVLGSELTQKLIYLSSDKLDWMPPGGTVEPRATQIFSNGHPFLRLKWRKNFADRLESSKIVRDRISHSGEKAETNYWINIAERQQGFKRPGAWLISDSTEFSAPTSNLKVILTTFQSMAAALSESNPDLDTLLGRVAGAVPEATKRIPGAFTCSICSTASLSPIGEPLGACPSSGCAGSRTRTTWNFRAR